MPRRGYIGGLVIVSVYVCLQGACLIVTTKLNYLCVRDVDEMVSFDPGQIVLEIVEREPIRPPKGSAMIQTPQIGDSIDQYFAPSTSGHCWTILR
jgi:hypothetical protein